MLYLSIDFCRRYDKIKGLPEAFETPGVCSNYSPLYVEKTAKAIQEFKVPQFIQPWTRAGQFSLLTKALKGGHGIVVGTWYLLHCIGR